MIRLNVSLTVRDKVTNRTEVPLLTRLNALPPGQVGSHRATWEWLTDEIALTQATNSFPGVGKEESLRNVAMITSFRESI